MNAAGDACYGKRVLRRNSTVLNFSLNSIVNTPTRFPNWRKKKLVKRGERNKRALANLIWLKQGRLYLDCKPRAEARGNLKIGLSERQSLPYIERCSRKQKLAALVSRSLSFPILTGRTASSMHLRVKVLKIGTVK
jgi:hypothetical protein